MRGVAWRLSPRKRILSAPLSVGHILVVAGIIAVKQAWAGKSVISTPGQASEEGYGNRMLSNENPVANSGDGKQKSGRNSLGGSGHFFREASLTWSVRRWLLKEKSRDLDVSDRRGSETGYLPRCLSFSGQP